MLPQFTGPNRLAQILAVLESSSSGRRRDLLAVIERTDQPLSRLLKARTLTLERIMGWPSELLFPVLARLDDATLARALAKLDSTDPSLTALEGVSPNAPAHFAIRNLKRLIPERMLRMDSINRSSASPSPANLGQLVSSSAVEVDVELHVISIARLLEREGLIPLSTHDPSAGSASTATDSAAA